MALGSLIPTDANFSPELGPDCIRELPEAGTLTHLHLAVGEVHLWLAALDQPGEGWDQASGWLDEAEIVRAGRFARDRERRRFLCRRAGLRKLLSLYLDLAPPALRFRCGPHGKPDLAWPSVDGGLEFSCSHSHGLALYALTRGRRIGVDLERLTHVPEAEEIARRWLSPVEAALWRRLPPDQKTLAFLQWWTQTEAYVKALGEGWVEPEGNPGSVGLFAAGGGRRHWLDPQGGSWSGQVFCPAPGYVAAVAVAGTAYRSREWR